MRISLSVFELECFEKKVSKNHDFSADRSCTFFNAFFSGNAQVQKAVEAKPLHLQLITGYHLKDIVIFFIWPLMDVCVITGLVTARL